MCKHSKMHSICSNVHVYFVFFRPEVGKIYGGNCVHNVYQFLVLTIYMADGAKLWSGW